MKNYYFILFNILILFLSSCSPAASGQQGNTSLQNTAVSSGGSAVIISKYGNRISYVESRGVKVVISFESCSRNSFFDDTIILCDVSWASLEGKKNIFLSPEFISMTLEDGRKFSAKKFAGVIDSFNKKTEIEISGIPSSFLLTFQIPKGVGKASFLNVDERFKNVFFEKITF